MSAAVAASHPRGAMLSQEKDYNHATDAEYSRFRDLAQQAYDKRQKLSNESQKAFKQGDGSRAKELSEQAKQQQQIAENYNMQAAEYVFRENNADSAGDEIDLHGLYVKEAEYIVKKRIAAAVNRRESVLKVIVGKGMHSANGVAKIKPAIEELCDEAGLRNYIDRKNTGVMVVELEGARVPSEWASLGPSDISGKPSKPQQAYHPQGQPQYQQHQQGQQHQQFQQGQQGQDDIVSMLLACCPVVLKFIKNL